MKSRLFRVIGLLAVVVALGAPATARAHPLGNFTVNHYSRIEPAGDGVRIFYVLDMAEIPTFQEKARIDADRDGQVTDAERDRYAEARADELRTNLHLTLQDAPVAVRALSQSVSFPPGQGGLETLRLEAHFEASITPRGDRAIQLTYRDDNDIDRLGWREIVARPGAGDTRIEQTTVPSDDRSDELRQYSDDLLSSPLDVREARLAFVPGSVSSATGWNAGADPEVEAQARPASALVERGANVYASLAATQDLSLPVILLSLATALVLGAVHALSPGHGKTVVAAYLVGSRGTAGHALFLGATVTATHTIGVYALGLVTLYLSEYVLPEQLYPVLEIVSGLLVVTIGGWLLIGRLRGALARRHHDHYGHGHAHGHSHGHSHGDGPEHTHDHHADHPHEHSHDGLTHSHGGSTHSHLPPGSDGQPVTWRALLALGVSGGLLPCPSALVVMLSAIALHRVAFGLLLIVAFSLGLAGVLVGIGLLLVFARDRLQRLRFGGGLATRYVPVVSAFVVLVAGLLITVQALPRLL
jgi:nickel/cobalt transporter (NicO) family protein